MTYKSIEGRRIIADDGKCHGCLICQLNCSYRFGKEFNISKSAITIDRFIRAGTDFFISFTENCDACGICAKNCPYDALIWTTGDKEVA
jgi:ferredoxin